MPELTEGVLLAGRYRIGRVLGSGGMSTVHEAEDLRMSRRVALKVTKHAQSPELTERLFREATAAARTQHPSVVTVFGYGTDEATGIDYLVMEKLEGEDLGARIARVGALPLRDVIQLGLEIADALVHVHAAGVIHRDLKPANVFLTKRGRRAEEVTLLDFGLAKQLDLQSLTGTGQVLGTAAYMAPEQIVDSKRVDARTDLYALGVVLFESATGRLPYPVMTVEELVKRVLLSDAAPEELPGIDAALGASVARCLRRKPSDRFSNARELYDQLRGVRRE